MDQELVLKEFPDGWSIVAHTEDDPDALPPWMDEEGHGPVSNWTSRPKLPGERVLCKDRHSARYYDFQAAVDQAITEKWGPEDPSLSIHARAARAAAADFQRLRDWCDDKWHYIGVVVRLLDHRKNEVAAESCWRIESDSEFWKEIAADLTPNLEKIHAEETDQDLRTCVERLLTCPELAGDLTEATRNLIADTKAALAKA